MSSTITNFLKKELKISKLKAETANTSVTLFLTVRRAGELSAAMNLSFPSEMTAFDLNIAFAFDMKSQSLP